MKKLVLTTVCALAMVGAAFAQGTIRWDTISPAGYTAQTNAVTYSPLFGGGASGVAGATIGNTFATATSPGAYDWAVLYLPGGVQTAAPTSLSALLPWRDSGLAAVQGAAGRISPVGATTAAVVPWANGTTDSIVLVGWSSNLGSTWLAVSNVLQNWSTLGVAHAFFGISVAGFMGPGSADPGSVIVGGGANAAGTPIQGLLQPLYLIPTVPEPGTLALAGLGGLSLLLFRRQRK